jgi:hypothetical protein
MKASKLLRQTEVKVFAPDSVNSLLFGKQPLVGPERNRSRSHHTPGGDRIDFTKYPFPPEIEPTFAAEASAKPNGGRRSDVIASGQPSSYTRLKHENEQLETVISHLDIYSKNSIRKTLLVHREMEEHFMRPLSRRLAKNVTGPEYESFVGAKERAVSAFDIAASAQDSLNAELPKIPVLRVTQSGLKDPIQKYKANSANELKLARTIAESQGLDPDLPKLAERDTMNLRKWSILAETRFYGAEEGVSKKGKRIYPSKYGSQIAGALDAFAPPEARVLPKQRQQSQWTVDHLANWE